MHVLKTRLKTYGAPIAPDSESNRDKPEPPHISKHICQVQGLKLVFNMIWTMESEIRIMTIAKGLGQHRIKSNRHLTVFNSLMKLVSFCLP